jgi:hypothetical protein
LTDPEGEAADDNVPDGNLVDQGRADRATRALLLAGAEARTAGAGVSRNTRGRILRGLSVKRSTLIAFAEACGVQVEWLIEGTGDMTLGNPPETASELPTEPKYQRIADLVDLARLGAAMRIARRQHPDPHSAADWVAAARDAADIYDMLTEQAADGGPGSSD